MIFEFNSRNMVYKSPFGAIESGGSIAFVVTARDGLYVDALYIEVLRYQEEIMRYPLQYVGKSNGISSYSCTVDFVDYGIYHYRFVAHTEAGEIYLGKGRHGECIEGSREWYQQTVFDKRYQTPDKVKGGVIYHIFIDRFHRGADPSCVFEKHGVLKNWHDDVTVVDPDGVFRANDFFGGNFQGIIDKLDYIKSLGVTQLYLSPIFKSGSNHRYDTGNYMQVDELLGDEDKFGELIDKAKAMGIGIILDGVFNHTGADSLYFNKFSHYDSVGAYQGMKSPYFDWYYFINYPDEYACWWGITVTPTVNKSIESYRQFIYGKDGVIDKWTKKGIAGWRLDVVDELDIDFVDDLCASIRRTDKDNVIIGEVWEDASVKIAYSKLRPYLMGNQLDGVMNYPFKLAIYEYCINNNIDYFVDTVMGIYENYPRQSLDCCMTLIGTHDTPRAINCLSQASCHGAKSTRLFRQLTRSECELGKNRMLLASAIQYILPGIPSVYYGDEVGMQGFEDPINRRPFPWDDMDIELLEHYQKLGAMRDKFKNELVGDMDITIVGKLLVIKRKSAKRTLVALFNNSHNAVEWECGCCHDAISNKKSASKICILPHNYSILYYNN